MKNLCFELLDRALLLGEEELAALNEGREEEAQEIEAERSRLTMHALEISDDLPLDALRGRLQRLGELQTRLSEAATELRRDWQQQLQRSRLENRRLAGYKQAATHAL